jgi:hypothetical protein
VSVAAIVFTTLIVTSLVIWIGANLATTEKRLLYRPRRLRSASCWGHRSFQATASLRL